MSDVRPGWSWDDEFDGGESGCGDLLVQLKLHFDRLAPGTRVLVRSLTGAAPAEMPAWCRLTGHSLLEAQHPYYLIRRKP